MSETEENNEEPVAPDSDPDAPTELDPQAAFAMGAETPDESVPSHWSPPEPETLDPLFPEYDILALLGRGGMGAVYKGIQRSLDRPVAIKLLPPELAEADPNFATRFEREAKAMARLDHPNIVHVYNFGRTDAGHWFIVMEFVDGMDFHQLIRSGELDAEGALNSVAQICDALQYAHEMGYVHRDIKPANIFINQKGILKVGDFGLAKMIEGDGDGGPSDEPILTMSGYSVGTPIYSAPEQLEGREVDQRADIYSLGVMFYEMLTRELPRGNFPPPSKKVEIDVRIDDVVLRAMESSPEFRYSSAWEMRSDVDVVRTGAEAVPMGGKDAPLGEDIVSSKQTSDGSRAATSRQVARMILGGGALCFLVWAGFTFLGGPEEPKPAQAEADGTQREGLITESVESGLFPLPLPEFPPKRPDGAARLVCVALTPDPHPLPDWVGDIEDDDRTDLVRISAKFYNPTRPISGAQIICLSNTGDVIDYHSLGDSDRIKVETPAVAISHQGSLGNIEILDREGRVHSVFQTPTPDKPIDNGAFLASSGTFSAAIRKNGRLDIWTYPDEETDVFENHYFEREAFRSSFARLRSWSQNCDVSRISMSWRGVIALANDGSVFLDDNFNNSEVQILPKGSLSGIAEKGVAGILPNGGILRPGQTLKTNLTHIDFNQSRLFYFPFSLEQVLALFIGPDASIVAWHISMKPDRGDEQVEEYERAFEGALDFDKSGDYLLALLPADTVSRSGYWEVDDLIEDRRKLQQGKP